MPYLSGNKVLGYVLFHCHPHIFIFVLTQSLHNCTTLSQTIKCIVGLPIVLEGSIQHQLLCDRLSGEAKSCSLIIEETNQVYQNPPLQPYFLKVIFKDSSCLGTICGLGFK